MPRMIAFFIVIALVGCNSVPACNVPTTLAATNNNVISKLTAELSHEYLAGTFDGVALVTQGDAVLLKSAYGCANRQASTANTATTLFDMGSIAKTFTAAAVLQLVHSKKLTLADTIGDFYPQAPAALQPVTIAQLLGHTSGLDNFHNDSDFELMDKTQAENRILAMPLIARPTEKIAYSNAAYTLLAAIVEQASGLAFQQYVHDNLLTPLKLSNTGFYQDKHLSISSMARGYGGNNPGSTTFEKGLTWALIGAGGMVTSIDDLTTWFTALKKGALFPAHTANLIFTPANERWLLGSLAQTVFNNEPVIQMGGSTDYGYTALIQYVPKYDLLVALLLNAHGTKYGNATHHRLSRNHILPILLAKPELLPGASVNGGAVANNESR